MSHKLWFMHRETLFKRGSLNAKIQFGLVWFDAIWNNKYSTVTGMTRIEPMHDYIWLRQFIFFDAHYFNTHQISLPVIYYDTKQSLYKQRSADKDNENPDSPVLFMSGRNSPRVSYRMLNWLKYLVLKSIWRIIEILIYQSPAGH